MFSVRIIQGIRWERKLLLGLSFHICKYFKLGTPWHHCKQEFAKCNQIWQNEKREKESWSDEGHAI